MAKFLWTQKQDMGPRARTGHAMAFDGARERTLLFGGEASDGTLLNDTWEWDGGLWKQVEDAGPAPRSGHQMTYDRAGEVAVLFGGQGAGAALGGLLRDTWAWNGIGWTQLDDTGPAARAASQLVFDGARKRTVLFGGRGAGAGVGVALLGDTWEWDGNSWTQVADTGPSARRAHAMAYDRAAKRVVLFGGDAGSGGLDDTWAWDGDSWVQVADTGPAPRSLARMAWGGSGLVLYGGRSAEPQVPPGGPQPELFGDTWLWSDNRWAQVQDIGPGARWGHAVVLDAERKAIVLFGGASSDQPPAAEQDTWHLRVSGPLTDGPELVSITVVPWTVAEDGVINVTVVISEPTDSALELELLVGSTSFQATIQPGKTSVSDEIQLNSEFPAGGLDVTARLGEQEVSTSIQVTPAVTIDVDLIAFNIFPDPAQVGTQVTAEVMLDKPAPSQVLVEITLAGATVGSITIPAGGDKGETQLSISPEMAGQSWVFTAVLGDSSAIAGLVVVAA